MILFSMIELRTRPLSHFTSLTMQEPKVHTKWHRHLQKCLKLVIMSDNHSRCCYEIKINIVPVFYIQIQQKNVSNKTMMQSIFWRVLFLEQTKSFGIRSGIIGRAGWNRKGLGMRHKNQHLHFLNESSSDPVETTREPTGLHSVAPGCMVHRLNGLDGVHGVIYN